MFIMNTLIVVAWFIVLIIFKFIEIEKSRHAGLIFSQRIMALEQNKVLFKVQITVACLDVISFKPFAPFFVKFWRK